MFLEVSKTYCGHNFGKIVGCRKKVHGSKSGCLNYIHYYLLIIQFNTSTDLTTIQPVETIEP
jgi:hypothetical protein